VSRLRSIPAVVATLVACSAAGPAFAQFPAGRGPADIAERVERLERPRRAPLTLTPSISVLEEYDDNVRFDNDRREWDLITTLIPRLRLTGESETWRVDAAYDFEARLFARDQDRNSAFDRQHLTLDMFYQVNPALGVSLADSFTFETGVNAFGADTVATGRDRSWSNSVRPAVSARLDRVTTLSGGVGWTITRFEREDAFDSDIYRADASLDRVLTRRLRGTAAYEFAFFDINRARDVTTHTPRLGVSYEITPTLIGTVNGGPSLEFEEGGDDRISPAVAASLTQRFQWGLVRLSYDRAVGLAGSLGGTTDNQTIGATLAVTRVLRGLTIEFAPRYSTFEGENEAIGVIDVTSISIPLQATYQITPWFALTGGYAFLRQRSESRITSTTLGTSLDQDVDQNRVFFGVQVGYPIRFD
jgi:hypothetical protein